MKTVTITYFGKEYDYPLLTVEDIGGDRIVRLWTYEISVQGYEQCYNETKRFHFLSTKEELAKLEQLRKANTDA
jgi:hypothetical protein